eukprot:15159841-Alexandrium_andersonii.AAC.1
MALCTPGPRDHNQSAERIILPRQARARQHAVDTYRAVQRAVWTRSCPGPGAKLRRRPPLRRERSRR